MKNLDAFERDMWPAMTARVNQMLDTPAGKIRDGSRLDADMRKQIDAAIPREAIVKPKKPRKLLVTDIQMYSGHGTIPHGNYMLELMAKYTGAFEPTFSNDPNLLKYPKIKEFDAVFLNNVCGMTFPDPEVREGILRFVREGGGIGGNHAVTFSNNHWPEYIEMLGGFAGAHHTEKQVMKVDDPNSPLTKSFGSASFEHTDEFYIMPEGTPYQPRQAARPDEHRRREIRPGDQRQILSGVHAPGSGLRRGLDQDLTAKAASMSRRSATRRSCIPTSAGPAHAGGGAVILGDLDADATPNPRVRRTN